MTDVVEDLVEPLAALTATDSERAYCVAGDEFPDCLKRETTILHDIFIGTGAALMDAGIVQPHQLLAQSGRRKGCFFFMPDGKPLTPGVAPPRSLPGFVAVRALDRDLYEVQLTVSVEERGRRSDAAPADVYQSECTFFKRITGKAHQLLAADVPRHWFENLPLPGKTKGKRTLYEGETRVDVSVGARSVYRIDVIHIDFYKGAGAARLAEVRNEWGLAPLQKAVPATIPRRDIRASNLRLVWSAP